MTGNLTQIFTFKELSDLEVVLRIVIALVVGGMVGLEREYKNRPAGMRTHVLVCLGAATVSLLESLLWGSGQLSTLLGDNVSMTVGRLSAQVISGIGFLGAGTIFMAQKKIAGLTTAASLWNVACIGILIGFGYYWLGLLLGLLITLVLQFLGRVIKINAVKHVEVKYVRRQETLTFVGQYFDRMGIQVLDIDFHVENLKSVEAGEHNLYTNLYTLHLPKKVMYSDIVAKLSEYPNIQSVRTRNA